MDCKRLMNLGEGGGVENGTRLGVKGDPLPSRHYSSSAGILTHVPVPSLPVPTKEDGGWKV
jgi:hypothetical protein